MLSASEVQCCMASISPVKFFHTESFLSALPAGKRKQNTTKTVTYYLLCQNLFSIGWCFLVWNLKKRALAKLMKQHPNMPWGSSYYRTVFHHQCHTALLCCCATRHFFFTLEKLRNGSWKWSSKHMWWENLQERGTKVFTYFCSIGSCSQH